VNEELEAYQARRRSKKRKRTAFLAAIVLLVFGSAFWLLNRYFFVVKEIASRETELYSQEEIREELRDLMQSPFLSLSKKEISSRLKNKFPFMEQVELEYRLPGTLYVNFEEDVGILAVALGSDRFAVNERLEVLARAEDHQGTRIALYSMDISSCIVGEDLIFAQEASRESLLQLLSTLKTTGMLEHVSQIDARDKFDVKLRYQNRFDLHIGEIEDLIRKFAMVKGVVADSPYSSPEAIIKKVCADMGFPNCRRNILSIQDDLLHTVHISQFHIRISNRLHNFCLTFQIHIFSKAMQCQRAIHSTGIHIH